MPNKKKKLTREQAIKKNISDVRRANTPNKISVGSFKRKPAKQLSSASKKQIRVSKKMNKAVGRKYKK